MFTKTRCSRSKKQFGTLEILENRNLLTAVIGGRVWFDSSLDGQRNGGEYEIADVTVNLLFGDNIVRSTSTDDRGRYEFENIRPGDFSVEFIAPEGSQFTVQNTGRNSRDSDVDENGKSKVYSLDEHEVKDAVDAGLVALFPSSRIIGNVWHDRDGDGVKDEGELPFAHAEVQLENVHGRKLLEVFSLQDGTFEIPASHILPGEYIVDFVRPDGDIDWDVSPIPVAGITNPQRLNAASPLNGKTTTITIEAPDSEDSAPDVVVSGSFFSATSIRGRIWHDHNRNGRRDDAEYPVYGIDVELLDAGLRPIDDVTSDEDGRFYIPGLKAGTYYIQVHTPANIIVDGGIRQGPFTVESNQRLEIDDTFVYSDVHAASVEGLVWNDLNADGIKDSDEHPLTDVKVTLQNQRFGDIVSTRTDEDGRYRIEGDQLLPGNYVLAFVERNGFTEDDNFRISPRVVSSAPDTIANDAQPTNAKTPVFSIPMAREGDESESIRRDAGVFYFGAVHGTIWNDADQDGRSNSELTGSVPVRLIDESGNTIDRTYTDEDGRYRFDRLFPANYRVAVDAGVNVMFVETAAGFDSVAGETDFFEVGSGQKVDIHGGIYGTRAITGIAGTVWNDVNGNGIQDRNEAGLANQRLELVSRSGDVIDTIVSLADGEYEFRNVDPQDVAVRPVLLPDTTLSPMGSGNDAARDSDINRWTGRSPFQLLFEGQRRRGVDVGVYAGPIETDPMDALRITEVGFIGHGNSEFVEVSNVSDRPVDISDVAFTRGIRFDFAKSKANSIFPGEYVVVVGNDNTLARRFYLDEVNVAGEYRGDLNREERLTIAENTDRVVTSFRYDDDWFVIMDNEYLPWTLTVIDEYADEALWDSPRNWRPSSVLAGTPGYADPKTLPDPGSIVINEVLTDSSEGRKDLIEIHNTTDHDIDIGNWFIGDSDNEVEPLIYLTRYRIAPGTVVPAGGFLVYSREEHFANASDPGVNTPFGLSKFGESVHLIAADRYGRMQGYSDSVSFDSGEIDVSFGRIVTSTGDAIFTSLSETTFGGPNASSPHKGSVVIDQIMYNATEASNEYLRLLNTTEETIDLSVGARPWRLSQAVDFVFNDDSVMEPGGHAFVVPGNPDAFRERLGVPENIPVWGPYSGKLSNGTDDVRLYRYLDADRAFLVDRVLYEDAFPWPASADVGNVPITRLSVDELGSDASNWQSGALATGEQLSNGTTGYQFATFNDAAVFGASYMGFANRTTVGDVNGDGRFNSSDLVLVFQAGKYEQASLATWFEGDWNGDGIFSSSDLVTVFQIGTYSEAAIAAAMEFEELNARIATNSLKSD